MAIHTDQSYRSIWILEPETASQDALKSWLKEACQTTFFTSSIDFLTHLDSEKSPPNLIVANLNLPEGNFFEVLKQNETYRNLQLPIFLSGPLNSIEQLRASLNQGAMDYLLKPYLRAEVEARLMQGLRILTPFSAIPSLPEVSLDPLGLRVLSGESIPVQLTPKEFHVFSYLYREGGKKLKKEDIVREVWHGVKVCPKTLDVHLFNLRRKLSKTSLKIEYTPPDYFTLHLKKPEDTASK